eukprot:m.25434 g.25434  ORF g.25434 m.25434 type:complete len:427 (+) comp5767_c0_seq1:99-1379(+)
MDRKDGTINLLKKHAGKLNVVLQNVNLGMPCSVCGDRCPGFELHVWKKKCKHCGCSGRIHAFTPLPDGPDVQKLQFVEEVPQGFDPRGYMYDDMELIAEPVEEDEEEDKYDNPQELLARLKGIQVKNTGNILSSSRQQHSYQHVNLSEISQTSKPHNYSALSLGSEKMRTNHDYHHLTREEEMLLEECNSTKERTHAKNNHERTTPIVIPNSNPLPTPPPMLVRAALGRSQSLDSTLQQSSVPIMPSEPPPVRRDTKKFMKLKQPLPQPPTQASTSTPASPPMVSMSASAIEKPLNEKPLYEDMKTGVVVCGSLCLSLDDRDLVSFLHHDTPRALASALLMQVSRQSSQPNGLFLIRLSLKERNTIVISVFCDGKTFHYQFVLTPSLTFENEKGRDFGHLKDLLAYFKDYQDKLCCCLSQCVAPSK